MSRENREELHRDTLNHDDDAIPGRKDETIHFNCPGNFRVHEDYDEYDSDDTLPLPPQHPFWSMEFVVYHPSADSSDDMD